MRWIFLLILFIHHFNKASAAPSLPASSSASLSASSSTSLPASLCQIQKITSLNLYNTGYTFSTNASIEHHALSLIIDTGSEGSLLTPQALENISHFQRENKKAHLIAANGERSQVTFIKISSLTLNQLTINNLFIPIIPLSGIPMIHPPIMGLLGMDILGSYDLEINAPQEKLTLWHVNNRSIACRKPPLWSGQWKDIHLTPLRNRFLIPFILNGYSGMALLDTGARSHILSTQFAHKIGITQEELARDPGGISEIIAKNHKQEDTYHWHRFQFLRIGDETEKNPTLTVAPLNEKADMLLGADWFLKRHLWLSIDGQEIFIKK